MGIKSKIFILLSALILTISVLTPQSTTAQTETPTPTPTSSQSDRLRQLQEQIRDTEAKISDLQSQEKTLSSQIAVIDNQIKLTEYKIDANRQEISDLTLDIDTATKKISGLERSLDSLTQALLKRIVATYEIGTIQGFHILLSSSDVTNFFSRLNYLKIAQAHDKRLIYETTQAKNDYSNQKEIFEDKKKKIESLKKELEVYTAQLDGQKDEKEQILAATKNDEAKFQQLLSRLRADAESISRAVGNIGYKIGPVNKGEVIASVGSSGCSTGPHLHFEVFTNARVEGGRIVGSRVDPKPYLDNGSYEKPVPNYPQNVTTWYGTQYFLGTHTGVDIANSYGTPIKAIESGEAYFTSAPCSLNIPGGTSLGKGIIVDHKNGLVTLYWHIP